MILLAASVLPLRAKAEAAVVTTFPLPAAPFDIEVESSDRVWFTLPSANAIGSLDVEMEDGVFRYTYTAYSLPAPNSEPYRLSVADGDVWFTQRAGNRIGRLSTLTGTLTEYDVPTPMGGPTGIDVAPDGSVWFAQGNSSKLAVLQPADGSIREIDVGMTGAGLDKIDARSPAIVWATAPDKNMLFGLRRGSNDIADVAVQDYSGASGIVRGLAVTPSGVPWVTTKEIAKIGSYLYGTLAVWLWSRYMPENADLVDILLTTQDSRTYLWGLDTANRNIVQIEVSNMRIAQRAGVGRDGSVLTALSLDDASKTVWVADAGLSVLYALRPPYSVSMFLPVVAR